MNEWLLAFDDLQLGTLLMLIAPVCALERAIDWVRLGREST